MRIKTLIIILLSLLYCGRAGIMACSTGMAIGDSSSSFFQVDSIIISGNERTDESIILRELTFGPGDTITAGDLSYNRERIYSLGLFTDVNVKPETGSRNINIAVEESWYFWPIPFVNLKDNSLDRATYGMFISYKNFRGMNETIAASVGLGYDPFISLEYHAPWFVKSHDLSLYINFAYMKLYNKNIAAEKLAGGSFSQEVTGASATLGKRLDIYNFAGVTAGFDYIESPKAVPGINAVPGRIDRTLKAGLYYNFDSRNLKQFPDSGLYFYASMLHKGFGIEDVSYSIISADYRQYIAVAGDLTAKWRLASKFALGRKIPFYDYSEIRYIRGHFRKFLHGDYSYTAQLELKYPIIREWDIKLDLPVLPEELTSYRLGLYPYIFADAGAVQMKNEKLKPNNIYSGYGAGFIILFLPYNIFRLELALDEYKNREFIIGFDFSF